MDDAGPYIALAVMAVLATAAQLLWQRPGSRRAQRIARALARRPRTWIGAARGGRVRVTGRIHRDAELLEAPLSRRPCVVCELLVEVPSNRGGVSLARRLANLQQARPFLLTDETGTARVDTAGPFFLGVPYDHAGKASGPYPGKHRALSEFLESRGINAADWRGHWRPVHYAEGVLERGELVSVGGDSRREIDQAGDSPNLRSPPERLVLRGSEAQPLLIGRVGAES